MSNAKVANELVKKMRAMGEELKLSDALAVAKLLPVAVEKMRAEKRNERVRAGSVARWAMEMRAAGAWDGE
jgi:hypothetical protein